MTSSTPTRSRRCALTIAVVGAFILPTGCSPSAIHQTQQPVPEPTVSGPASIGIATQYVRDDVEPGDDFYTYVNEGWIEATEMPPGYAYFTATNAIRLATEQRVNRLVRSAAASDAPVGPKQQIGALYASYMDADLIEAKGLGPIQEELTRLLALATHEDVARWMANPRSHAITGISIYLDPKDTSRDLVYLDQQDVDQGILGLPGKAYYTSSEDPYARHRAGYREYIAQTLARAGIDRAEERAGDILALETALSSVQWDPSQLRDREANYHLMARTDLPGYAPGFPWQVFLEERGVGDVDEIILGTNTAVRASAAIFAETPVDVWRSYLVFHWIDNHALFLPEAYGQAAFEFFGTTLGGVQERMAREQRATRLVGRHLGQVVGKLYVGEYFPPEHRTQVEELVGFVRRAFRERLEQAAWMDEETRLQALAKLDAFDVRIGYPDTWRDYSAVVIDPADLVGNFKRIKAADWRHQLARLDGGTVRDMWWMAPQVVDAAYSPQLNAVTFPAGILQPPLFNPDADAAVNFGAIGAVIGHEMGHGFDDQGSRFDSQGHLRDWWTPRSREQFEDRTRRLVEQYSAFSPLPGVSLNGRQTVGENIADLIGVMVAHRAYQLYLDEREGGTARRIDGLTGDQRFFMAWAQAQRSVWSEEALRANALRSYHAPGKYRANGVVRNIDAWYDAFEVTDEHDLYVAPTDRVRLW